LRDCKLENVANGNEISENFHRSVLNGKRGLSL